MNSGHSVNRVTAAQRLSAANGDSMKPGAGNAHSGTNAYEQGQIQALATRLNDRAALDTRGFRESLELALGSRADRQSVDALVDAAVSGDLPLPNVRFVEPDALAHGALGTYDAGNGGTILLDRSLLSDPGALEQVFTEAAGHHFDALVGAEDAADDQGAIFAQSISSHTFARDELSSLGSVSLPPAPVFDPLDEINASLNGTSPQNPSGSGASADTESSPSSTPSYFGPESRPDTSGLPKLVNVIPAPDELESNSQISSAALVGSTLAGGINLGKDYVDRFGGQTAADILTAGNANRLPAPGFADRADLANTLTDVKMDASTALNATPFSAKARSTQVLESTLAQTNALGRFAGVVGNIAAPLMGAYEGYAEAPENATVGERVANALGGGIKENDDGIVSGLAGAGAGVVTAAGGTAITFGGATLPAGAVVIASAPVVATGASITASS